MANSDMKRCSTQWVIREMQTEIALRYHYAPLELLISLSLTIPNVGNDVAHLGHSYIVGRLSNGTNILKKKLVISLVKLKTTLDPEISLHCVFPNENIYVHKNTHTRMSILA